MSLRTRGTAAVVAVSFLMIALIWIVIVIHDHRAAVDQDRQDLASVSRRLAAVTMTGVVPNPILSSNHELIQVVADDGRVLAATPDLTGRPPLTQARPVGGDLVWNGTIKSSGTRLTVVGFTAPNLIVYTAKPQPNLFPDPGRSALLGLGGLALVSLLGALTWRTIGRVLAPVEAIRAELGEITATDLSRRVPQPKSKTEISLLATTVNDTLLRLEQAVNQQRRFVADASHELRSPITALRAEVDLALLTADGDYPEDLQAIDRSTDRMQTLVEDLLAVARLDAGIQRNFERLDLNALVDGELARRHDPKILIKTDLQPGVKIDGVRVELSRLLVNLLDNAARHAASTVWVSTWSDRASGEAVLEVRDDGAGLPHKDRERVFRRFTRLAEGRARDPGGSGLGLAIAREIAEYHFGTLRAEDSPRGARFVLRLSCAG